MKYLDYPLLNHLSKTLSANPSQEHRVHARFEAYSVKPIGKERKMFKEMEEAYVSGQEEMEEMSFSPEMKEAGLSSCFGRLDEKEKVHFLLVSTLNAAFPDHDFSALRPDQFTREPNSAQVLSQLHGTLLGQAAATPVIGQIAQSASSPLSTSPMQPPPPPNLVNPDIYRILNDVLPLDECEVYSWFPEPEYDPHMDLEDGEVSEGEDEEMLDDMDIDEPSWGTGGMEIEGVTPAPSRAKPDVAVREKKAGGGLLWSANYFFYSRRQKRVLFLTTWCRKRGGSLAQLAPDETSVFPSQISSSFTSGSAFPGFSTRPPHPRSLHNRANARPGHKRSRGNLKATIAGDMSSTIPIRGMETPRSTRLATSAPSSFTPLHQTPSQSAAAMARMTAGGFKPKQTPARMLINAAAAAKEAEEQRVRKERSESAQSLLAHESPTTKGKRVKV
ncbi:Maf1 regulator-domain-containing protein [Naematelia encephala]|uniref:Maf1 regulator-domain-containing protein n=1 Tax=Naematelia encephala TaxID=71784 RepID=A0A1Y2ASB5_9TREE|nr:Maf1 regulator-domain-containing protein [Naematelia encephala]